MFCVCYVSVRVCVLLCLCVPMSLCSLFVICRAMLYDLLLVIVLLYVRAFWLNCVCCVCDVLCGVISVFLKFVCLCVSVLKRVWALFMSCCVVLNGVCVFGVFAFVCAVWLSLFVFFCNLLCGGVWSVACAVLCLRVLCLCVCVVCV